MRILATVLLFIYSLYATDIKSTAFYYGVGKVPTEFNAFDAVVVEGDNFKNAAETKIKREKLFAYVSVGEVDSHRAYFKEMPKEWLVGKNTVWKSAVIDQSKAGWAAFFVNNIIKPLRDKGYENFFFDTMDSYQLIAKTPQARAAQEAGMIAAIELLKQKYPKTKIILNRGFEVLPKIHSLVDAVAAESLYGHWDESKKKYETVKKDEHDWLLLELNKVKNIYKLPVISIEYVEPSNRAKAREVAQKVKELGFIPYVTNGSLDMLGIGQFEIKPRRILMIYDESESPSLSTNNIHLYAAMPLNYLGYITDYADVNSELPESELSGLYAGIVAWITKDSVQNEETYAAWLEKQIKSGVKVAVLDRLGLNPQNAPSLNIKHLAGLENSRIKYEIEEQDESIIGFEKKALNNISEIPLFKAEQITHPILTLRGGGEKITQAALTKWGGFALAPNTLFLSYNNPQTPQYQAWIINPLEFFKKALELEPFAVPDTTTENGKRLFFAHVDGDSFVSQIEFDDGRLAGAKMYEEIFSKYKVPQTVSVIEAETAAHGIYPKFSQEAEKWAKEIYKLPYIEAATHTFSHPFAWNAVEAGETDGADKLLYGINLKIKDYKFNFDREIVGSKEYIQKRLLPSGKKVKVILWTGDCIVGEKPMKIAQNAELFGMNGGDTTITKARNSISLIAPLGRPEGGEFQVYGANQNENVYTNNWTGPFYGYEKVIETFELTDKPHRFKPINIYYHFYTATKKASLNALKKVYDWSLKQDIFPIYGSEYIQKAHGFNSINIAQENGAWIISDSGELRELRAPKSMGYPDMRQSYGVSGFFEYNNERYIHLTAQNAKLIFTKDRPKTPYVESVNGSITDFSKNSSGMKFTLHGHTPPKLTLANAQECTLFSDGKKISAAKNEQKTTFLLPQNRELKITLECRR